MVRVVMVALDGSPHSETVLHYVPGLVRPNDEVFLVQVAHFPTPTRRPRLGTNRPIVAGNTIAKLEPDPPTYAEDEEHALDRVKSEMMDYLQDQALFLRNEGLTVHCDIVFDDDAAGAIVRYARAHGPLFIAMATHGRSGLDHVLHGSVVEDVIKSGVAPVLAVKPGDN